MSFASVLLPEPVRPTRAIFEPTGHVTLTSLTAARAASPYRNVTPSRLISPRSPMRQAFAEGSCSLRSLNTSWSRARWRSEEHTSELQSQFHLVCRLLLEKKKQIVNEQQQS